MSNYFCTLNSINVNDKTEKKGGLTYLSWALAWGEVKKLFPDATYTIYEASNGWNYHTDGRTCWVKTGVTVNGIEHIEYLPVMDNRNNSISAEKVTSFDVNKAIQRSLTKAVARHGLGLYIYAGEDLPEVDKEEEANRKNAEQEQYEAVIASVKEMLSCVVDADSANVASTHLKDFQHVLTSERDTGVLWNRRMKELNLFYDRVLKQYAVVK
ncbi:MAG: DUF1071 domain-containing protein [Oscillospiraceae bacterium]|nr:DUF1071 domain-containing protein [Oscillospiraceae bacterium]